MLKWDVCAVHSVTEARKEMSSEVGIEDIVSSYRIHCKLCLAAVCYAKCLMKVTDLRKPSTNSEV